MSDVEDELFEVTKDERRAAMQGFRRITRAQRREIFEFAKRGEPHPDPALAGAGVRWARTMRRQAWWNRIPGWVQPAASIALMVVGWWIGAGIFMVPGGALALLIGLAEWNNRQAARMILRATPSEPGS